MSAAGAPKLIDDVFDRRLSGGATYVAREIEPHTSEESA